MGLLLEHYKKTVRLYRFLLWAYTLNMDEKANIHFGLDVAVYKANIRPEMSNLEIAMEWAKGSIDAWKIRLNTPDYDVLVQGAEHFEVTERAERQQYFRFIFNECLSNGREEPTTENNAPVFGLKHLGYTHNID